MSMASNRTDAKGVVHEKLATPVFDDGRTKQSFKDETDINKIMYRAQKSGTISHIAKHEARYGDFVNFDFFESQLMLTKGREIFDDLPSEIRTEFHQSQSEFFNYVNDPENKDRLGELLPALAAPGRQVIDVSGKSSPDDASEPLANDKPIPPAEPKAPAEPTPPASTEPPAAPPASS